MVEPAYYDLQAIEIASKYHLEKMVIDSMNKGLSPEEALREWDLI